MCLNSLIRACFCAPYDVTDDSLRTNSKAVSLRALLTKMNFRSSVNASLFAKPLNHSKHIRILSEGFPKNVVKGFRCR